MEESKNHHEVSFYDSDFDQDFRKDPLTAKEMIYERIKEQRQVAEDSVKKKKEEFELKKKEEEEKQYSSFKERYEKEQEVKTPTEQPD
jgi:hypothetical protein